MNKQQLIERMESLKNLFGNKAEYIEIDAAIKLIEQLDELQKVTVPQFVADWYEEYNFDLEFNIWDWIKYTQEEEKIKNRKFTEWLGKSENDPVETLVKMKLFGYDVEEEKRYYVRFKFIEDSYSYLTLIKHLNAWTLTEIKTDKKFRTEHTKKQLEQAGFGWVFNCPGIEVEEVD